MGGKRVSGRTRRGRGRRGGGRVYGKRPPRGALCPILKFPLNPCFILGGLCTGLDNLALTFA